MLDGFPLLLHCLHGLKATTIFKNEESMTISSRKEIKVGLRHQVKLLWSHPISRQTICCAWNHLLFDQFATRSSLYKNSTWWSTIPGTSVARCFQFPDMASAPRDKDRDLFVTLGMQSANMYPMFAQPTAPLPTTCTTLWSRRKDGLDDCLMGVLC